jgi:NAD-dependent SIR2 family protein deacetylase
VKLKDLEEARYATGERWVSEHKMDELLDRVCFEANITPKDFWTFYHNKLLPLDNIDQEFSHKFLSDLSFRRRHHVNTMNETLDHWDAGFRVSDMRWASDEEDADIEWKVLGDLQ